MNQSRKLLTFLLDKSARWKLHIFIGQRSTSLKHIFAHPQSKDNIAKSNPKQKSIPKSLDLYIPTPESAHLLKAAISGQIERFILHSIR